MEEKLRKREAELRLEEVTEELEAACKRVQQSQLVAKDAELHEEERSENHYA